MQDLTWSGWLRAAGLRSARPVRRNPLPGNQWGLVQAERLEERALLSAVGVAPDTEPVAADVARHTAKAFEFPQVAGDWGLLVNQETGGTAVLTQKGKAVTAVVNFSSFGEFTFKGKFTKSSPNQLSDTIKVKDPELGKYPVSITIVFSESASPLAFTGTANIADETVGLAGNKQIPASLPNAKSAPEFENVEGTWNFTIASEEFGTHTGILTITQDGKENKNVNGTVALGGEVPLTISGKFNKKDLFEVSGKANVPVPNSTSTVKANFTVTFNIEYDAFGGTATSKKIGIVDLDATRTVG